MFDINAWELVIILLVAFVVIGPERLPEYAAKLGRMVRQGKLMAENARGQLREQLGPEYDDIDWRAYDPRQYDPRRIVRDALADPDPASATSSPSTAAAGATPSGSPVVPPAPMFRDPTRPTPYDTEAT